MFELFKDELDSSTYGSIEEYNREVLRVSRDLQEELGKVERILLTATPDVLDDLGVAVRGVSDD